MADNAQSILRRVRDMYNNPRAYLEQLTDHINNFNRGEVGVVNDRGAGMRKLSDREQLERYVQGVTDNVGGAGMGALGVIKSKGGNWLTGSVEGALKGLKRGNLPPTEQQLELIRRRGGQEAVDRFIANGGRWNAESKADVINKWIEGPLTKYVKRDMATEGDPVRKLAEQGILHVGPDDLPIDGTDVFPGSNLFNMRQGMGQAGKGVAYMPMAKNWEASADMSVIPYKARMINRDPVTLKENPWLGKVDPETEVFDLSQDLGRAGDELGFKHLTDELVNALNPESGLPRNLLLNPEDMPQMGMERAVRHVANINAWRAAQKAEADAALANNAATRLHKEYPENNPKGLRWVELKSKYTNTADDKAYKEFLVNKEQELGRPLEVAERKIMADQFVTQVNAEKQALQDALKYEGDAMGHCVGGYCPDVLEGRSRIFSLRDAKGQPHVTIETMPGIGAEGQLPEDIMDTIKQIKGKQNRAPNDEYLPFVQDFVKSGKWSDVGDLRHAQMWKNPKTGQYHTIEEARTNPELEDIYASRNLDVNGNFIGNRFAQGGLVEADDDFAYPGMF